ncbi:MAG: cytoplasmic protein [Deltaproteobacteria bacterium]|nr:cytoplasmic protein [Deltaproteobacteria bacterium]
MNKMPPRAYSAPRRLRQEGNRQFERLVATELYCPKCKRATPARERLLLVLPEGEKYEYLCAYCGTSVGDRIDRGKPPQIVVI